MSDVITIYGSCVSREPFNEKLLENIKIKNYIQKNNLVTLFDEKIEIEEKDILNNPNFLKRMTYFDFNKKVVEILKNEITDWLVIDFCEMRYGVIRIEKDEFKTSLTNCPLTRETLKSLQKQEKFSDYKVVWGEEPYWYNSKKLDEYVDRFVNFIKGIYSPEKIIIIRPQNCFEYVDKDGLLASFDDHIRLQRENLIISNTTDLFYKKIGNGARIINLPHEIFGDMYHKLGHSALHYEKSCYQYMSECIFDIINNNISQEELNKRFVEYDDVLKQQKRVLRIKTNKAKELKKQEENKKED